MIRALYEAMMVFVLFLFAAYWWEQEMSFFKPTRKELERRLVNAEDELEVSRAKLEEAGLAWRMQRKDFA